MTIGCIILTKKYVSIIYFYIIIMELIWVSKVVLNMISVTFYWILNYHKLRKENYEVWIKYLIYKHTIKKYWDKNKIIIKKIFVMLNENVILIISYLFFLKKFDQYN